MGRGEADNKKSGVATQRSSRAGASVLKTAGNSVGVHAVMVGDRDLSGCQECRDGCWLLDHERVVTVE